MTGSLAGLRVLDLSRYLPGPFATLVLSEWGARVDCVEPPAGDPLRAFPPLLDGDSAYFHALARGKRSVVLDCTTDEGAAALRRLAQRYDVLVEGFRPGHLDRLGLGYASLSAENPRLVFCSITGFGQTGPHAARPGHDLGFVARAGLLGQAGPAEGPPAVPPAQLGDVAGGGWVAVSGILAALHERQRTGRGRHVDVSMTEGALSLQQLSLGARLAQLPGGASEPRGRGLLTGGLGHYGIFRTRDGRFLAAGGLEPKFLLRLLERLSLASELAVGAHAPGAASDRLRAALAARFAERDREEWLAELGDADVCVEPVWEGDEVLNDPQLRARGRFVEGGDPRLGSGARTLRVPLGEQVEPRAAPRLGEHTAEVLREAGFTQAEIDALLSAS